MEQEFQTTTDTANYYYPRQPSTRVVSICLPIDTYDRLQRVLEILENYVYPTPKTKREQYTNMIDTFHAILEAKVQEDLNRLRTLRGENTLPITVPDAPTWKEIIPQEPQEPPQEESTA